MVTGRSCRSSVFIQLAIEVQPFEDEFDGRSHGRGIASNFERVDRFPYPLEMTQLMDVIHRRHHLRP